MTNPFEITSNPEYSHFISLSRYARWLPDKKRRETWDETVKRYIEFFKERHSDRLESSFGLGCDNSDTNNIDDYNSNIWTPLFNAIYNLEVLPSMRAVMTAGPALKRDEIAGYNCSAIAMDRQRAFDEIMYVLMCGVGLGFSVERQYINKLPEIAESFHETETTLHVRDSKIGWAASFRELISLLYAGQIPKWDTSKVRSEGAPLKTFGGRASGPGPLEDLFRFTVETFKGAAGRKLNSLEVSDIVCKEAETITVGGVRRSALLTLSNLTDDRMRTAKSGQWWETEPQRALANGSVAYTEKPTIGSFMKEWMALYDSKSGERGVFNREGAQRHVAQLDRRDAVQDFLLNPCGEVLLRSKQLCNLSTVVVRSTDTFEDLKRKVRFAAILGTFQSTLTNFRYVTKKWKENCEEERLLGVSLTGIMDHKVLSGKGSTMDIHEFTGGIGYEFLEDILEDLKRVVIDTNKEWSKILGIEPSVATTVVKPEGTVSQLVDSASGIHPRFSKYYIRTVRADKKDPLAKMMTEVGFPVEDAIGNPSTQVFSFPIEAPDNSVFRDDMTAIEQLELWLIYKTHWTEHNPSQTIYVREHEWMQVGAWVYEHFDEISGVSFLPHTDHIYKQAPYQQITKEEYNNFLEKMPKDVDWSLLGEYEENDMTIGVQEYSCTSGQCEI